MRIVIIPDYLYDEITAKLDDACAAHPEMTDDDKAEVRAQLVGAVDEYGYVPDFSIQAKAT